MDTLITFIQAHAEYAHYLIFASLLLAGFNIPISEDGMLFVSALLASQNPEYLPYLFLAVYLGAYFSDLICYALGRIVGPKILHSRLFKNGLPPQRIEKIHQYYEKYGVATLIFGRFIPFGVRNGLFLCAGLGKMNFIKFALSDWLACTISTITFFSLYYHYGSVVVSSIMQANIVLFIVALLGAVYIYWHLDQKRKR